MKIALIVKSCNFLTNGSYSPDMSFAVVCILLTTVFFVCTFIAVHLVSGNETESHYMPTQITMVSWSYVMSSLHDMA